MKSVWKSYLSWCIKVSFFQATVKSVLLWLWIHSLWMDGTLECYLWCWISGARNEQETVWLAAMVEWRVHQGRCNLQVIVTDTGSWQTFPMGAIMCIWALIEGSPHNNNCGGSGAGCWGGELCGVGQMYGWSRLITWHWRPSWINLIC